MYTNVLACGVKLSIGSGFEALRAGSVRPRCWGKAQPVGRIPSNQLASSDDFGLFCAVTQRHGGCLDLSRYMKRSRTTGSAPSRAVRRITALGVALTLFAVQQSWAAVACLCDYNASGSTSCNHHKPAADAHNHHAAMHHKEHSSGDQAMNAESVNPVPQSFSCCKGQPQAELPVISFSAHKSVLIGYAPRMIASTAPQSLLSIKIHEPPVYVRQRPLYLSLSSLLI